MNNIKIILSILLVLTIGCCIYLFVCPSNCSDCPNCPDCPVCPTCPNCPDCPKLPKKYPSTSVKPFPTMGKDQYKGQLIGYNGYSQLFLEAGLSPNMNDEYLPDADNKCESGDTFHTETKTCSNKGGLVAQFVAGLDDDVSGIHAYTYVIGKTGQIYNTPI